MNESLYRGTILEHSRNPRNAGRLEHPSHRARAANPLCGDEMEVTLMLADGRVRDIRAAVRGCVITQAAASLMTTAVVGRTPAEVRVWAQDFRDALEAETKPCPAGLESLRPLLELRNHRSRIGCALLPWTALERALHRNPDT